MSKIVVIFLLLVLCSPISVKGITTIGTFTPLNNYGPHFSDETPANNTADIALSPLLSIQANDTEGDLFNLTFSVYSDGSWVIIGTNNSVSNGTYICTNTSIIQEYSTTYQWKVSGIDYRSATNETIYHFTTEEIPDDEDGGEPEEPDIPPEEPPEEPPTPGWFDTIGDTEKILLLFCVGLIFFVIVAKKKMAEKIPTKKPKIIIVKEEERETSKKLSLEERANRMKKKRKIREGKRKKEKE